MKYFKFRLYASYNANFIKHPSCEHCGGTTTGTVRGWLYLDEKAYYANYRSDSTIIQNSVQNFLENYHLFDQSSNQNLIYDIDKPNYYIRICPYCRTLLYGYQMCSSHNHLCLTITVKRC